MSSSEFHERFESNPLCDFRLGTVATSDHEIEPGNFKGRIIFMSMYNDIEWDKQGTKGRCEHNSQAVAQIVLVNFLAVIVLAWAWIRKEVVRN